MKIISGTLVLESFLAMVARFIKAKSNITLSGRQRAGRLEGSYCLEALLSFLIYPGVWERASFLSNYPVSFGSCVLLSNLFPRFSQASALPLLLSSFGSYCTCLIVLLHHLASAHVLSKGIPSVPFSCIPVSWVYSLG